MRKASIGILAIVGIGLLLMSFVSMGQAYFNNYAIGGAGGPSIKEVGGTDEQLVQALRGIRGTSAAYAGAFAVLLLAIVFGPYKRGEKWAWWAIMVAGLLHAAIVLLRLVFVGTSLGVGPALTQAVLVIVGLLLDVSRLKTSSP